MKRTGAALLVLALSLPLCREKKQIVAAKGNSIALAQARCTCEKLQKKTPPGDLTRCTNDMAKATRYLKINFEFNSFNDSEKQEITKAGDEAYAKCLAEP